jgi:PAS domain-containing protein
MMESSFHKTLSFFIADEHFLLASAQISEAPIVYCSDGFTKMTGYKKSQVVKKKASCSFMFGSLTTKDAVRLLRNAIQEKTSAQIEILLYKRDGRCSCNACDTVREN